MTRSRHDALDILKQLPRTNCRECRLPTCFAFANQLAHGQREARDCPYLDGSALEHIESLASGGSGKSSDAADRELEKNDVMLDELSSQVREIDFAGVADRIGAQMLGSDLVFKCLGKDFTIDTKGRLRSPCHANFWVLVPLLDTIVQAANQGEQNTHGDASDGDSTGEWVKFDQLRQILSSTDFVSKTCESSLRLLADRDERLFTNVLEVFGAKHADHGFAADLSVVLHPLPRLPILLCYWRSDSQFDSKLSVYFDRSADRHVSIESAYILMTGIVEMLKKIVTRHSFDDLY